MADKLHRAKSRNIVCHIKCYYKKVDVQNGVIYLLNNFIDFTIFRRDGDYYNPAKPNKTNMVKEISKVVVDSIETDVHLLSASSPVMLYKWQKASGRCGFHPSR
jgi:hypothetical protein